MFCTHLGATATLLSWNSGDLKSAQIFDTLAEMGENPEYSEQDFLQCFTQFGPKGRGYITKTEMMIFIKKVAGIDTKTDEGYLKLE